MRWRIERSIVSWPTACGSNQWTSLDSLLGVGYPARARAVRTMENSSRTSSLLV